MLALIMSESADILWHIVQTCVAASTANPLLAPCLQVTPETVLMRDRHGVLQRLLLPTQRITGIEDARIASPNAPDYWTAAWQGRPLNIDASRLSITINGPGGRTQNQLHLHVSCTRLDVLRQVRDMAEGGLIDSKPRPVAGGLREKTYFMQRIDPTHTPVFAAAYQTAAALNVPASQLGAALIPLDDSANTFALLLELASTGRGASAERLQDHDCAGLDA